MREMGYRMILALGVFALAAAGPVDVETSPFPVADAAEQGDRETVRALLQQGIDVNAAQGGGTTALHWAARANDIEMAEMLLYAHLEQGYQFFITSSQPQNPTLQHALSITDR